MLTKVTAVRPESGTLELPLLDSSGGYSVRDIQGLDPVKATLTSSSIAQKDGANLQNSRREPRNIIMKLGLEPDYVTTTVASLRAALYRYFMPKSQLTYGLYSDDVFWGDTLAVVESFDNVLFSADPEVSISMLCYDPDFYAPADTEHSWQTVNGSTTHTIAYEGTSETGIELSLTFPGVATGITIYNTRPDNNVDVVNIQGSFLANDLLKVCTVKGSKSVTVTRGGIETSVLSYVTNTPDWISLMQGNNLFRVYYNGASINYTLKYRVKYGGF